MKKLCTIALLFFVLINSFGQPKNKTMVFLSPEFSKTLQDGTKPNNEQGIGFGVDVIYINKSNFSPVINVTDDGIFLDDKVLRTSNGIEVETISNVLNVFAGMNYDPTKNIFVSFTAGPSLINSQILFGVKPSIGVYFPKTKRWMAKIAYTNVFNRNSGIKENYSALSFSIGIRLF